MVLDVKDGDDVAVTQSDTMRYAAGLLERTRQELDRADAKSTTLLAGISVGIGAVLAGIFAGEWSPRDLIWAGAIGWWLGSLLILLGVAHLVYAVYPRVTPPTDDRPVPAAYYGDIVDAYDKKRNVGGEIRKAGVQEFDALADQVLQVSLIVRTKYAGIRKSIWLVCVGFLLSMSGMILDSVLDIYSR